MIGADTLLERIAIASFQGGLLALLVWAVLRVFPRLQSMSGWLWLLVLAKFGLTLGSGSVPLAVLPVEDPHAIAYTAHLTALRTAFPPAPEASPWPIVLCTLWAVGFASIVANAVVTHLRCWKAMKQSVPVASTLQVLAGSVPVRVHPRISVPFVIGIFRPTIVLPEPLVENLSEDELRMVLAHEMAHVKRKDLLAGLFAFLCHAPFFFHPCAWLAKREWHLTGEAACDRIAIEQTQTSRAAYAAMLMKVSVGRSPASVLSASPTLKTLRRRIENMKHNTKPLSRTGTLVTLAIAAAIALPIVLVAQTKPAQHKTAHAAHAGSQDHIRQFEKLLNDKVARGEITQSEAAEKLRAFKIQVAHKTSIEHDLAQLKKDLQAKVKEGKLTEAQAKEIMKKRLDEIHGAQHEKEMQRLHEHLRQMVAKGEITQAQADEKLAHSRKAHLFNKVDFEKMAQHLKQMVDSGQITQEEANKKLEDLRRKMEKSKGNPPPQ